MEKSAQNPTDQSTMTSLPQHTCCGGKMTAGKAPQGATEPPVLDESASSQVKDSSGCCGGHR